MEILASTSSKVSNPLIAKLTSNPPNNSAAKTHFHRVGFQPKPSTGLGSRPLRPRRALVAVSPETTSEEDEERSGDGKKRRYRWARIGPNLTEAQEVALSGLPQKMTKRCQAVIKQIVCFSDEDASILPDLLAEWARIMKPQRADWLTVLRHLKEMNTPLSLQVLELALQEESFEPNVRDYTKIIHEYGKQNRVREAENTLSAMRARGFICDQVTLTAFVDMYGKAGNLSLAEKTFEELRLMGEPLDKRSYGSMIMAYVRAGMPGEAEALLREMDSVEVYAGSEVYKAVLRAYSMGGDPEGAQRVFEAAQLAGVIPDARLCGLVINACVGSGRSEEARAAFENMRRAGIEPSDKCVALVLSGYEKEERLGRALEFLMELERDGVVIGEEASERLVGWFTRLGVAEEVELALRELGGLSAGGSDFSVSWFCK